MLSIDIVAAGAVSPFGLGAEACAVGAPGELPLTRVGRDERLAAAGLRRPFAARVPLDFEGTDRAGALLGTAAELLVSELDERLPRWRSRRLALCVGTSAGGIPSLERALADIATAGATERDTARSAVYDGPLRALRRWFDGPVVQVLAACASSTVAIGLGCRWLELDFADLVIAGGYDALTTFVATGFEALGATTQGVPQPFREARAGMVLGEGAALVALVRGGAARTIGTVRGFAVGNDACHVTGPDPTGGGLARAARGALADAGATASDVGLVSAHATATLQNDAAEARAIADTFGDGAANLVVHAFKPAIGHCLGAAGALELLAALGAVREGMLPATCGAGALDAAFPARLLERNESDRVERCLKLSSGFGGTNAALLVARAREGASSARQPSRVRVLGTGGRITEASLASIERLSVVSRARLERLSSGSALCATAVASALDCAGLRPGANTGVVLGATVACLDDDVAFERVRRERGARAAEPRTFVRTSPNLPAAECAIVFGIRGPAFAVGGGASGPLVALLVAHDLVACGDAEHVVVDASDEVGAAAAGLYELAGLLAPDSAAFAAVLGRADAHEPALDRAKLAELLGRGGSQSSATGPLLLGAALLSRTLQSASS